jgi:hypothetical protein
MRSDVVTAVKGRIEAIPEIAMVSGLGVDKPKYPLVRVWAKGTPAENLDNSPQARIDLRLVIQVETFLETVNDATVDDGLYDAVDAVFAALHGHLLPGRGSQPIIVYDNPGLLNFDADKRVVYQLQASVRVMPGQFALTIL